jgi:hypothetical protein
MQIGTYNTLNTPQPDQADVETGQKGTFFDGLVLRPVV